jgi:hypothetical protein
MADGPFFLSGVLMQAQTYKARQVVFEYIKPRLEKTDKHVTFSLEETYVVWFTYILGNWKALVSTTLPDGMYYEVTYNTSKNEIYLDAYKKFDNICIEEK